ncbi:MAG: CBS domain-containing protein [Methanomassiliicoccales archaeon]|nr:CBS domain-containing protein [Methanomassiliicoccales archaeon]
MKFPDASEIRRLRKSVDLTQVELANLSGVSQSTIAKIERGGISGSYDAIVRIFKVLHDEVGKRRQGMRAKDVASGEVVSVQVDEKVKRVSEIMRETGYSQLPVFEGPQPVGSVSEYGVLMLLKDGARMEDLAEMTVGSIMDGTFPVVSEETPIETVTSLLSNSHAVLTARRGRITGIITSSDVLKLI